ncbi:MAG TPA: hypothetical protein PLY93_01275 [Turneriella sp.]|nr:hypothetical protein [Turneriella sp.]
MQLIIAFFFSLAFTFSLLSITPLSTRAAMHSVENDALRTYCAEKGITIPCTFRFDTAVRHRDIWAFSFILTRGAKRDVERTALRTQLETPYRRVLEIDSDSTKAIQYFRETGDKLIPLEAQTFYKETINPKSQIVVKYAPDFLLKGGALDYTVPPLWESEGVSPSTTSSLALQGKSPYRATITGLIRDLDDKPITKLTIESCHTQAGACPQDGFSVDAQKEFMLDFQIKAARKLKHAQPVFKFVVQTAQEKKPIAEIAIPFKPQPNYFLFGVVGFLVGGLIAVMTLMIRSNTKRQQGA